MPQVSARLFGEQADRQSIDHILSRLAHITGTIIVVQVAEWSHSARDPRSQNQVDRILQQIPAALHARPYLSYDLGVGLFAYTQMVYSPTTRSVWCLRGHLSCLPVRTCTCCCHIVYSEVFISRRSWSQSSTKTLRDRLKRARLTALPAPG